MLKKIMLGVLAAGALALNAPAAIADDPAFDCGFDSSQQEDVTGQNYEGAIYGYIVHGDGSLRCYITVNGTDVGADVTVAAPGAGAKRISFSAGATDSVKLCWTVTTSHGTTNGCAESTHTQFPPEAFYDALDTVIDAVNGVLVQIDPTICPIIGQGAGTHGPITIAPNGNIYVDGELWYVCP